MPALMEVSERVPILQNHNTYDGRKRKAQLNKNIGFIGGVCLLVNSMTGPALISIPAVIQDSGWLTPAVIVLVFWAISSLSSLALCEAMSYYPGNDRFQDAVELTTLVKYHFGSVMYYIIFTILNTCLLSLNVASIIATAQTIDFAALALAKHTCGLEFYPRFMAINCIMEAVPDHPTPFGPVYILSVGMVLVLLVVVPLGYINLNKNIVVQIGAVLSVIAMTIIWTVDFARVGFESRLETFGWKQEPVLGTIMFNFVVGVTVPSWCSEKKLTTSPRKVIFTSTALAAGIFLYVGLLGAAAFKYAPNENFLTLVTQCERCSIITRITGYYLPSAVFLTSIPVYSIIVQYNLVENKICGKILAFFVSVVVPWCFAVPFYTGAGLLEVINWASLFLQSFINFILPMIIVIKARAKMAAGYYGTEETSVGTDEEEDIAPRSFKMLPSRINFLGKPLAISIIILIIMAVIFVTILNVI
jgi:hypothetical protein